MILHLSRLMTKPKKWYVCPAKTDQPEHPPSLIRVFTVCMKKAWVFSYPLSTQRRLWSDWADAQADLSLRWAHSHFVGFVMRWLILMFCFLAAGPINYSNDPKFSDRQIWAISIDPDQTAPKAVRSGPHCMPFRLRLLDALLFYKTILFKF